ncbi:hypothetical protein [Nevskia soli]|uniref:hypothetical protein n=1 Tax=Nevskia soli TaxID=418856 RepID=UPI0012FB0788|nr:hypothetical protein [Nevskia soli]
MAGMGAEWRSATPERCGQRQEQASGDMALAVNLRHNDAQDLVDAALHFLLTELLLYRRARGHVVNARLKSMKKRAISGI